MSDMLRSCLGRASLTCLRLVALACACALGACLVTNKAEFDQPAIPAVVERIGERIKEFQHVPPEPDERCLNDRYPWMGFEVSIDDLNNEKLDVRVAINGKLFLNASRISVEEQATGYSFCIDKASLPEPCNLVEVLTASEFAPTNKGPYNSAPNGDLGSTHWWVIQAAATDPFASYLDCPNALLPDGGMP